MEDLVVIEQIVHTYSLYIPVSYYTACTCASVGICLYYNPHLAGLDGMECLHRWVQRSK